ncbi:Zinc/iron permease [Penicillium maclennaniae]|uniref:Zinc/iron permease n=1 Tax=Penicillium maclennaniae TaxID=1343394 RepID=UPI002542627B|nr:Zinc/iron permease [Penicillium maclennaniae]KAJ5661719.1 Zinc/iron permease [Penicillium maclennaniae]
MPGAIALGGIFLVTVIEMVFSPAQKYLPWWQTSRDMARASLSSPGNTIREHNEGVGDCQSASVSDFEFAWARSKTSFARYGSTDWKINKAINCMGEGSEEIGRVASAPEIRTHHGEENGSIQMLNAAKNS